jgi:hypothetical protein
MVVDCPQIAADDATRALAAAQLQQQLPQHGPASHPQEHAGQSQQHDSVKRAMIVVMRTSG